VAAATDVCRIIIFEVQQIPVRSSPSVWIVAVGWVALELAAAKTPAQAQRQSTDERTWCRHANRSGALNQTNERPRLLAGVAGPLQPPLLCFVRFPFAAGGELVGI
jgi:hypothetical protein